MKKRLLSILLIVCLCAAFLPTAALAAEGDPGSEKNPWILTQGSFTNPESAGSPVKKEVTYVAGHSYTYYNLQAGYYKLGGDVTIESGDMIRTCGSVTLDLNGHSIKKNANNATVIEAHGDLTLNDSNESGTISGHIRVYSGTFTMYGGSLCNDVFVQKDTTFHMMGGECKGEIFNTGGTITGGVFYCKVENTKDYNNIGEQRTKSQITGGVFYNEVNNRGEITGGVFFGEIKGNQPASLHTVTFSTGEAKPFATARVVGNNQKLAPPKNEPTKDGFRFTGWFDGETKWNFETGVVNDNLTLTAGWEEIPDENPDEQPDENPDGVGGLAAILDDVPFVDVDFNDYYYDSVKWAYHSGVTGGTDAWHFSPNAGCTRAQAVTFLWRAAGCPSAGYLGNFTDVDADAYYAPAVAWAVANGVTNGTSATTFSPEAACSRGDIVTFLFRAFGGVSNGYHPFGDVPANAYYADAVAWAYEHNVTGGTSSTTFSPADPCSRAQIVTFLYRVLG